MDAVLMGLVLLKGDSAGGGMGHYAMEDILIKAMVVVWLLFVACRSGAWNAVGHEVIASIAYDRLTPAVRKKVDVLTGLLEQKHHSGYMRFLVGSVWADRLYRHDIHVMDHWHFIDQPWYDGVRVDRGAGPRSHTDHVVWAIQQAISVLQSQHSTDYEKAFSLRLLLHFVADIHQPLHCITRYTPQHPQGDRGGNDFLLSSKIAPNLHALWDRDLGLLSHISPYAIKTVSRTAREWAHRMHPQPREIMLQDPNRWAQESYQIARRVVYTGIQPGGTPSVSYRTRGQAVAGTRMVLAGCRLAALLNRLLAPCGRHCEEHAERALLQHSF